MSKLPAAANERRRFARTPLRQPVKWQDGRGGRYHCGRSQDVSAGGMLIEAVDPVALRPGQAIRITVPVRATAAIVEDATLADARVVRVSRAVDGQSIAVAFVRDTAAC